MKDDKELSEEAKIAVAISHETLAKVLRKYELADHAIEFAEWMCNYCVADQQIGYWQYYPNIEAIEPEQVITSADLYKIFIKEKEGK